MSKVLHDVRHVISVLYTKAEDLAVTVIKSPGDLARVIGFLESL